MKYDPFWTNFWLFMIWLQLLVATVWLGNIVDKL